MNLRIVLATTLLALTAAVAPASAYTPGCLSAFATHPPVCIPDPNVQPCGSELFACQGPCLNELQCVSSCPNNATGEVVAGVQACSVNPCDPFQGPSSDDSLRGCVQSCGAGQTGFVVARENLCFGRINPCDGITLTGFSMRIHGPVGCPASCLIDQVGPVLGDTGAVLGEAQDCLGVRELLNVGENATELVGNPVAIPVPGSGSASNRNDCRGDDAYGDDTFADCPIPRTFVSSWGYYYAPGRQNGATHASYSDTVKNNGRWWYEVWSSGTVLKPCTGTGGKGSYADSLSAGVSRDTSSWYCDTGPARGITASFVNS